MARKSKPEEQDHHDRWLVSYADFITLLFAFFVVMYAISQVNQGKYRVLSNSLNAAFSKPDAAAQTLIKTDPNGSNQSAIALPYRARREAQEAQQLLQEHNKQVQQFKRMESDLKQDLAKLIEQGQVSVTANKRGITVNVNASLLFPVGSATLDGRAESTLSDIAKKLADSNNLIQIEGHTDNVPISSPQFPSNWELSAARAGTVVRLFAANGINERRLVAIGYGDNRPLDTNDSPAGRAKNRRVAIQILTDSKDDVAMMPVGAGLDTGP
jgi:chemotaxis protein MotB